jgi:hypothetical protein
VKATIERVISGGQTGVDQAALRAALHCGLTVGGWCPPGHVCESGKIPAEFGLVETPLDTSPDAPDIARSQRTEWNVRDSDATLILTRHGILKIDRGTAWTAACAQRFSKPVLTVDPSAAGAKGQIDEWLSRFNPRTLNIAGPSERTAPGIYDEVYTLVCAILSGAAATSP